MTKNTFYCLEDTVAIVKGRISTSTSIRLKGWLKSIRQTQQFGTLLIDSKGGIADTDLLVEIFKTPLHVHVLDNAQSWAMCMALCASHLTCNPKAVFMNHASQWDMLKSSEEVAEDQHLIDSHNYKVASMLSSTLPAGSVRNEIAESLSNEADTYFAVDWLWENAIIDHIAPVDLSNLDDQKMAKVLEEMYNE